MGKCCPALMKLQRRHSSLHSSSRYLQAHNRFFCLLIFLCGVWGQLSAVESRFRSHLAQKKSWLVGSHSDHFSSFSTWMCHISHMKWDPAASSSHFWSGGLVITLESTSERENLIKSSVLIIACVHAWAARVCDGVTRPSSAAWPSRNWPLMTLGEI